MSLGRVRTLSIDSRRSDAQGAETVARPLSIWIRLLPILFFFVYLNATVLLFAFGPWPWPIQDGTKLYLFLILAHLALLFGYWSVISRAPRGYSGKWTVQQLVRASLIANLLLLIPTSLVRSGSGIPDVVRGLSDPGLAYSTAQDLQAAGGGLVEYIRIILGPLLFLLLPLTIFYWQKLRPLIRVLAAFSILGFLAIYVATGTNKALADFILLAPWLLFASYLSGTLKLNKRARLVILAGCLFAFTLFVAFFASGQLTRPGSGAASGFFSNINISADPENFLVRNLPDPARVGMISLTGYLVHGYYGLYLSLDEPWVPMFGIGNSMFLYRNVAKLTGINEIEDMPYPVRIERRYGWDAYGLWSSIYPWIASDVSFPGTILVVFLIGRLFALAWLDTLRGSNPFAVAIFAEFIIMIFYFSANNQVLQSGEGFTGFVGILIMWLVTRRRSDRDLAENQPRRILTSGRLR